MSPQVIPPRAGCQVSMGLVSLSFASVLRASSRRELCRRRAKTVHLFFSPHCTLHMSASWRCENTKSTWFGGRLRAEAPEVGVTRQTLQTRLSVSLLKSEPAAASRYCLDWGGCTLFSLMHNCAACAEILVNVSPYAPHMSSPLVFWLY